MNSFEYAMPKTVDEAVTLLSANAGESFALAGGTDLVTSLKQGIVHPSRLVSLRACEELKGIDASGDSIKIGALTTLAELVDDESIQKNFPSLVTAARGVTSAQIMNVGTVGGDLCQLPRCWYFRQGLGLLAMLDGKSLVQEGDNRYHAIFGNDGPAKFVSASSLAPALVALGATVTVRGAGGKSRDLPVADLFHVPASDAEAVTSLAPNEVVTHIALTASGAKNATYEIRERQTLDWPMVAASVAFKDSGGKASDVKIVLGHVAPTPWVSAAAAKALEGKSLDEAAAKAAGDAAAEGASPLSKNGYKVQLVKVAVKRAVLAAAQA